VYWAVPNLTEVRETHDCPGSTPRLSDISAHDLLACVDFPDSGSGLPRTRAAGAVP